MAQIAWERPVPEEGVLRGFTSDQLRTYEIRLVEIDGVETWQLWVRVALTVADPPRSGSAEDMAPNMLEALKTAQRYEDEHHG